MKKKIISTIFFILLSLIVITFNSPSINSISDLKTLFPAKGNFDELVLDYYLDKSADNEFDDMYMVKNTESGYIGKDCNDIDLLYETLDRLSKIELRRYYGKIDRPSEFEYHINLSVSTTGEHMEIVLLKDYLIVLTEVLDIKEDKAKKIILPDTVLKSSQYKITDNNLEDGYLEEMFDTME
jgi:hypothetical protein